MSQRCGLCMPWVVTMSTWLRMIRQERPRNSLIFSLKSIWYWRWWVSYWQNRYRCPSSVPCAWRHRVSNGPTPVHRHRIRRYWWNCIWVCSAHVASTFRHGWCALMRVVRWPCLSRVWENPWRSGWNGWFSSITVARSRSLASLGDKILTMPVLGA